MEKPQWMICLTHMFIEIYLLIQVALIPVIIREFQLSLLEASLIATVPSSIQLFMNLVSGILSDRIETKYFLFSSMLIEGFSAVLVSQTTTFWMLVFGVSLLKISSPLYHIVGLSQLSRLVKPEQMSRSMGFHNALGNVGTAAGVVSLAVFLSTIGWRWTYLFWALPILIWGFIVLSFLQLKNDGAEKIENRSRGGSFRRLSFMFSLELLVFLIAIGVREVGATGSSTFMTTYFVDVRNLSDSTASLVFGFGPFMGIVGSLVGGYLGERIGAKKALGAAIFGLAFSIGMLSLLSSFFLVVLFFLFYAFFNNAVWSPMNTMLADLTPASERGLSFSIYFFTEGIVASITPTLAAGVIELTDVLFIFPFCIIFLVAALLILQVVHPSNQSRNAKRA